MNYVKDPLLSFELDLDLRPEGKQGVRVRSLDSYAAYYDRWADVWEFQALIRARPIGSERLCTDFVKLIDPLRYPSELSQKSLTEIRRIKARVENERLPQGADSARHLKLGRGSLSDVEWLVQVFQMRYAHKFANLRKLGTIESLMACVENELVTREEFDTLERAWRLASRARSGLVLANDKSADSIPSDRRQLEALARILEYSPGAASDLEEDYLSATRKSRVVFERLFVK
jgi:glutamate-ammonia-ligase adenylyltransferase